MSTRMVLHIPKGFQTVAVVAVMKTERQGNVLKIFRQPAMGWGELYDLEEHDLHDDGEGPGHGKDHLGGGGKECQKIWIGKNMNISREKKWNLRGDCEENKQEINVLQTLIEEKNCKTSQKLTKELWKVKVQGVE